MKFERRGVDSVVQRAKAQAGFRGDRLGTRVYVSRDIHFFNVDTARRISGLSPAGLRHDGHSRQNQHRPNIHSAHLYESIFQVRGLDFGKKPHVDQFGCSG